MTAFLDWSVDELRDVGAWTFHVDDEWYEDAATDRGHDGGGGAAMGRIEIFERPHRDGLYVAGFDAALGMPGRDFDAMVVLDRQPNPPRQVAELHGHWGASFARTVYAVSAYFGGIFIVGERQFGLYTLQTLLRDFGYGWLYYERHEDKRNRDRTDKLGYFKRAGDPALTLLQRTLRENGVVLRSVPLIQQLSRLQWVPRNKNVQMEDASDGELKIRLAGGGSPDLAMACMYSLVGLREVPRFERPADLFPPGSMGDMLGHSEIVGKDKPKMTPHGAKQLARMSTRRRHGGR